MRVRSLKRDASILTPGVRVRARRQRAGVVGLAWAAVFAVALTAAAQEGGNPAEFALVGSRNKEAHRVNEAIYQAIGFGNTFLVVTDEGNVVIDTSSALSARNHHQVLTKANDGPIRYVILTHGHGDHTGGIGLWMQEGTQLIASRQYPEFRGYQDRLAQYFIRSNAAQFGLNVGTLTAAARLTGKPPEPTLLVDDQLRFTLGGVEFQIFAAPGETPDHLLVWVPTYKAAFIGDNFYDSFPNMYTLRGTTPRWPLQYIAALERALELEPELLLPSHGMPTAGAALVRERLVRYRDAIEYVHAATLAGMNEGKDVFTLMREIKLPPELDVGELYGKVSWSVRGIFEAYVGWFDLNPASMYSLPPTAADAELVRLAGGPQPVVRRALELIEAGDAVRALRLTDAALEAAPADRPAREARLAALRSLFAASHNTIERSWLHAAIQRGEAELSAEKQPAEK